MINNKEKLRSFLNEYFKDKDYHLNFDKYDKVDIANTVSGLSFSVNEIPYIAYVTNENEIAIGFSSQKSAIDVADLFFHIDVQSIIDSMNKNFVKLNSFFKFVFNYEHDFPKFQNFKDIFDVYASLLGSVNKFNELRYMFQLDKYPFYMNIQLLLTINLEKKSILLKDYYYYGEEYDMYNNDDLNEATFESVYDKLVNQYITRHIGVTLEEATEQDKLLLKMMMV